VAEKVPGKGEEEQVGTYILQCHPEGGSPNNDPRACSYTDQPVQESKGEEVQAESNEHYKEFEGMNQINADGPIKSPYTEKAPEQKSETGCRK